MKYSEPEIDALYKENLDRAVGSLSNLQVANGRKPSFQGLNGWVYEQTIRFCLEQELSFLGVQLPISEQVQLRGRAKVDLLVGHVAIEIKSGGIFGKNDSDKYKKYKLFFTENNLTYLYITRQETHKPYYMATKAVFGDDKSFFLTEKGAWMAFVKAVVETNGIKGLIYGCYA